MSKPIQILHIGAGLRGRDWLDFIAAHPETTSVACVEPDAGARAKIADRFPQGRVFEDVERAIETVEADAALITSPSFLHAEHALEALDAGMAVLVEKPFTVNVAEGQQVIERGRSVGRPVIVAEQFRWVPAERTVRKLIAQGRLGEISSATVSDRRRMPASTQGVWTADLDYAQLQEVAVHHFDSLRAFFDRKPTAVTARVWNPKPSDYKHGACTEALIEMEGGLHVQYLGTLTSHKFAYSAWIEGENGVLWTNRKQVWWRPSGGRFFKPVRRVKVPKGDGDPYPREGTTSLIEGLVAAVRDGTAPETRADDNIWTIAMMQAGKLSDRERRTVAIEEVLR